MSANKRAENQENQGIGEFLKVYKQEMSVDSPRLLS